MWHWPLALKFWLPVVWGLHCSPHPLSTSASFPLESRLFSIPRVPFEGHEKGERSLRLMCLVSFLLLKSALPPLMLDIVALSQMHKFSCRPAASLRLYLGKYAIISSIPDFPASIWSFYHIKLIQSWTCEREKRRPGICPLALLVSAGKGKLLSLIMIYFFLCPAFLSELTLLLDSFLAPSSRKILKNLSGRKITGCSFDRRLRLYICL